MHEVSLCWSRRRVHYSWLALVSAVLCSLACPISSWAEIESSGQAFDVWPVESSWQPNAVTALIQSQNGYLWLGTYNGLVRFDGVRMTVFDSGNAVGLTNSRITSLYQDSNDVLWIGHETGELSRLAHGQFDPVSLNRWPGGPIEGITSDENNELWLLNERGILFRLRDGQKIEVPGAGAVTRKVVVTRASNGQLWTAANGLISKIDRGKAVPFQLQGASEGDFYQAILPARGGGFWAVVNGSLGRFREGRWESELSPYPGAQTPVTAILETRTGLLLIGTLNEGLFVIPPGATALHFSHTNGLSHDWVRALCEDHEGNVWIGTGGGMNTLRPRRVRMLNAPDGWHGRAVLSFTARPDGSCWVGTEGAGLYRHNAGKWTNFTESSGLNNLFVWSVLETSRGELFVGTWGGGLMRKGGHGFEPVPDIGKGASAVLALYEGSAGELWVGTTSGLYRYEHGHVNWFADQDKLALPDVRAITQTHDGTLWFGMLGGGLGSLKNGTLKQYRKAEGLVSDFVLCLCAEEDGTLWIGTADRGLARLKAGTFSNIAAAQGLPTGIVTQIVDDGAGNFWMGSHSGILRASKAELGRCADGQVKFIHCQSYGKAEGLVSPNCPGGFQPGACKTADGVLWFPTTKGLARIDPAKATINRAEPPVVIEELLVDGKPVARGGSPGSQRVAAGDQDAPREIAPGKHRFEIRYTGLSFAAPDKVLFKYQLEGLEREWMDAQRKRVAEYSYLPPGDYTFRVTACNNDEIWNDKGASLSFSVLPSVWQTWWFRIAATLSGAISVAALVLWITRRRVRARVEDLQRQQAVERERARIARDIHDDLGASLTRITLLSQTVRSELQSAHPAAGDVDQIYGTARELTRAMDEIVWAVNPQHDSLDSLVTYLGRFAQNFLSTAGIRCRLDVPLHLPVWPLTAEIRHNVFLAFKEALNNVVKHARASEVRISLEMQPPGFILRIVDNGCGFELNGFNDRPLTSNDQKPTSTAGSLRFASANGLLNMRKRLDEIGGRCDWDTAPGEGTRVRLVIAVKT